MIDSKIFIAKSTLMRKSFVLGLPRFASMLPMMKGGLLMPLLPRSWPDSNGQTAGDQFQLGDLRAEVEKGLDRLQVTVPCVRIVMKNVSWESSRDEEFLRALDRAMRQPTCRLGFLEFDVVEQRKATRDRRKARSGRSRDDGDNDESRMLPLRW